MVILDDSVAHLKLFYRPDNLINRLAYLLCLETNDKKAYVISHHLFPPVIYQ